MMNELKENQGFKVYSWKLLLYGLFLSGGFIVGLFRLEGWFQIISLLMILYSAVLIFRGALTREGYDKYRRESLEQKTSARARLGRFAFMDGMGPILLLVMGLLTAWILPEKLKWMALVFLLVALVLMFKSIGDSIEKMDEETRREKERKLGKKTEDPERYR